VSDGLGELHVAAVLALLNEVDNLTIYDGAAPPAKDATYPHAVVYPDPGMRDSDRLSAAVTNFAGIIQITGVGTDRWQAGWACDHARDALVGVRPEVAGRNTRPIEQLLARPIEPDKDDPANVVCYGVMQFRISSTPA